MEIEFLGKKGLNRRHDGEEKKLQGLFLALCADEQLLLEPGFDSSHVISGAVGSGKTEPLAG